MCPSALSELISILEKDYKFTYRQHLLDSTPTTSNPLLSKHAGSEDEEEVAGAQGEESDEGLEDGSEIASDVEAGAEDAAEASERDGSAEDDESASEDSEQEAEKEAARKKEEQEKKSKEKKKEFKMVVVKEEHNAYREEIQIANKSASIGAKKKGGFFSRFFKKKEVVIDEGGIEDIYKVVVVSGGIGSMFPKWADYIGVFQALYDIDILAEECEKVKLESNQAIRNSRIWAKLQKEIRRRKLDRPFGRSSKLKIYGASVLKRQKKIVQYWKKGKKKNALRVATMVAEVMGVVKKKEHYPVIYCEAVRCIAIFGRYVKSRFKRLIFDKNPNQKVRAIRDTDFLGCDMPDSIREIADNWVTFCGNIPDLTARIYISINLIFLHALGGESDLQKEIKRIIYMLNCLMDPLVYSFAACFLLYQIQRYQIKKHKFMKNLILNLLPRIKLNQYKDYERYLAIFFKFTFQYVNLNCTFETKKAILEESTEIKNGGLIFCKITETMPQEYVQSKFKSIVGDFLSMEEELKITTYPDFIQLMSKIHLKDSDIERFARLIPQITSFEKYIESLPHFLNLFGNHSDKIKKKELTMLTFEHLNEEMGSASSTHERFEKLDGLFKKMIDSKTDLTEMLTFEPFLNLLHYPKKKTKLTIVMNVLKQLNQDEKVVLNDPVLAYTILDLTLNLTKDKLVEEVNQASKMLESNFVTFVRRVDFGKNVEESLNFITKVRSGLADKFKTLSERMVYKALELIEKSFIWAKGKKLNKNLGNFIQACCAFGYISLVDLPVKKMMNIGLHVAQVTLQAGYSSLTDSILQKLLEQIEKQSEDIHDEYEWEEKCEIYDQFKGIISLLVLIPDNPESEHFSTLNSLLSILKKHEFKGENLLLLVDLYAHVLSFYAVQYQDELPYRLPKVKSNDQLYKGAEFRTEVMETVLNVFEELYEYLDHIKENTIRGRETFTVKVLLRVVSSLCNNFAQKGVVNKLLKLAINTAGKRIKEINNNSEKKAMISCLKACVEDFYLLENSKLSKIISQMISFFNSENLESDSGSDSD